jgi:hypothetical protein
MLTAGETPAVPVKSLSGPAAVATKGLQMMMLKEPRFEQGLTPAVV